MRQKSRPRRMEPGRSWNEQWEKKIRYLNESHLMEPSAKRGHYLRQAHVIQITKMLWHCAALPDGGVIKMPIGRIRRWPMHKCLYDEVQKGNSVCCGHANKIMEWTRQEWKKADPLMLNEILYEYIDDHVDPCSFNILDKKETHNFEIHPMDDNYDLETQPFIME